MNKSASAAHSESIRAWLLDVDCRALDPTPLIDALAERISREVPLTRLSASIPTKHPELWVLNIEWKRSTGARQHVRKYSIVASEPYVASPAARLREGAERIRGRLSEGDKSFAFYEELRADRVTDYYALGLAFGDGQRTYTSFATDAPDGFTDAQIALFESLRGALAVRLELAAAHQTTRSLLGVYLGENAASRVLTGSFRRGSGELARAAIIFSDMRGFTSFADQRSPAEVVETLDRFFEAVGGHIHDEGGEILKFIGDAVLAIFRTGDGANEDPSAVCTRALRAAEQALDAVAALNATRASEEPLHLGVALHFGDVMYGNIGARDRLDFTVIGAAVNEASRIEGLCKVVNQSLLASSAFIEALGGEAGQARLVSVGKHAVKGVGTEIEVFARRA